MRAASERIPKKNTKSFSGIYGGLCSIELERLLKGKLVKNLNVFTNDREVVDTSNAPVSY